MPDGSRIAALFRARNGLGGGMNPDLESFNQSLGLGPRRAAAQTPAMPKTTPQAPTLPKARQSGIPALDALAEMPRKPNRGLVHDRVLGRVVKTPGGV